MSRENVAAVKRVIEAINRGEVDSALREIDERAEFVDQRPSQTEAFRGHGAFRPHLANACRAAKDAPIELRVIAHDTEHVVAMQRARGADRWVARSSRQGRIWRVQVFAHLDEALEAVGLSE
jgi:ketosteroid isomerase-like protein